EGIKRAADIIAASDLAIVMLDSTTGFTDDDNRVLETASNTKTITALNKKDLFDDAGWERIICSTPISIDISISALTGENLDILKGLVYDSAVGMGDNIGKEIIITNRRHFNCLIGAVDEMQNAAKNIEDDVLFAEHLRLALNHLGEITGEVTTEEILNSIFDNFCIGK
ncbi:MAG: hypothetical protein GY855_06265, partial [candidate division Zixibacteria bacterium]|nr:hypothetical protein [candidate division Zixibacteria bacterium]